MIFHGPVICAKISKTSSSEPTCGQSMCRTKYSYVQITPPNFIIAPQKRWLEDYFPVMKVTYQGLR